MPINALQCGFAPASSGQERYADTVHETRRSGSPCRNDGHRENSVVSRSSCTMGSRLQDYRRTGKPLNQADAISYTKPEVLVMLGTISLSKHPAFSFAAT
jgi:hypothetical protein